MWVAHLIFDGAQLALLGGQLGMHLLALLVAHAQVVPHTRQSLCSLLPALDVALPLLYQRVQHSARGRWIQTAPL